jgi:hypothetical protein
MLQWYHPFSSADVDAPMIIDFDFLNTNNCKCILNMGDGIL